MEISSWWVSHLDAGVYPFLLATQRCWQTAGTSGKSTLVLSLLRADPLHSYARDG